MITCREEILRCARKIVEVKGHNEFQIADILQCMKSSGTSYEESTIRTHITSKMCINAPDHHAKVYDDLERVGHGIYKLLNFSDS